MDRKFYQLFLILAGACIANVMWGEVPGEVRVAQAARNAQTIDPSGKTRLLSINAMIAPGSTIRTGNNSHAEVNIGREIVVRLAANTELTLGLKPENFDLKKGALLAQASQRARGAKISVGVAAAAIGGATAMIEHHPGMCKFLVLEGTGRLYRPAGLGDSVLVGPGQMVIGNPDSPVSDPVDFDIARFMATSHFIVDLPALRSQSLIAAEIQKQQQEKSEKTLIDTNLVIHGGGTLVSLVDPAQLKRSPASKPSKRE